MRIENDYLIFDDEKINKKKKISGHNFVDICGWNEYKKRGDCVLEMLGLYKQEFDEKYLLRGNLAEKIVKHTYEKKGYKCTIYDKYEIKFDNFKENERFGGLIDIELINEKTIIEVKSKSMKDYQKINEKIPKCEVMQGLFYCWLKRYDKLVMEYIFFDEETENEVFMSKKPTTLSKLKRISVPFELSKELCETIEYHANISYDYYNTCYETRKIPIKDISESVLEKLNLSKFDDIFNDLQF